MRNRTLSVLGSSSLLLAIFAGAGGFLWRDGEALAQSYHVVDFPNYKCTVTGGNSCILCPPNNNGWWCGVQVPAPYAVGNCNNLQYLQTCRRRTQYCGGFEYSCVTGEAQQTTAGPCNDSPNYCYNLY